MKLQDTLRLQVGNKLHDYNVRGEDNTYLTDYILSLIEEKKIDYDKLATMIAEKIMNQPLATLNSKEQK